MTISEIAKKYDIKPETLRYYEKIGLLSHVPRNKNGIRNYNEENCGRIEFIICMRNAGVEIETLRQYVFLLEQGEETVNERKELLIEQREKLLEKQKDIHLTIERLNYKIENYEKFISKEGQ